MTWTPPFRLRFSSAIRSNVIAVGIVTFASGWSFLNQALVSHLLGVSAFATYMLVLSSAALLSRGINLGAQNSIISRYSKQSTDDLSKQRLAPFFRANLRATIIAAALVSAALVGRGFIREEYQNTAAAIVLIALVYSTVSNLTALMRTQGKFILAAMIDRLLLNIIVVSALFCTAFLLGGKIEIDMFLLATFAAWIGLCVSLFMRVVGFAPFSLDQVGSIKEHGEDIYRHNSYFFGITLAFAVYNQSSLIIYEVWDGQHTEFMAFLTAIKQLLLFLPSVLNSQMGPTYAAWRPQQERSNKVLAVFAITMILVLIFCCGMAILRTMLSHVYNIDIPDTGIRHYNLAIVDVYLSFLVTTSVFIAQFQLKKGLVFVFMVFFAATKAGGIFFIPPGSNPVGTFLIFNIVVSTAALVTIVCFLFGLLFTRRRSALLQHQEET
jgi:hypothetical protein